MLNRKEIMGLVRTQEIIKSDTIDRDLRTENIDRDSSFQPGSIDLHVGEIYLPSEKDSEVKSCSKASLRPGGTILVKTLETCNLPPDIGGICFAPATLSLEGLLIVNIGHIDPGYKGQLHFTIVNLGKENKEIRKSDILVTMLLYKYSESENPKNYNVNRSIDEILPRLSDSFMDFEKTIDKKINKAAYITPVVVTVIGICLTFLLTPLLSTFIDNTKLRNDIEESKKIIVEQQSSIDSLDSRIHELEAVIHLIQNP